MGAFPPSFFYIYNCHTHLASCIPSRRFPTGSLLTHPYTSSLAHLCLFLCAYLRYPLFPFKPWDSAHQLLPTVAMSMCRSQCPSPKPLERAHTVRLHLLLPLPASPNFCFIGSLDPCISTRFHYHSSMRSFYFSTFTVYLLCPGVSFLKVVCPTHTSCTSSFLLPHKPTNSASQCTGSRRIKTLAPS